MPLSAKMFLEQCSPMEEGGSHIMLEHCVCGKKYAKKSDIKY